MAKPKKASKLKTHAKAKSLAKRAVAHKSARTGSAVRLKSTPKHPAKTKTAKPKKRALAKSR